MLTRVNFIMGYLGAGKTTFIQSFLESGLAKSERLLLIVNDFGQINYDEALLENFKLELQAITYGCLCCDLKKRFHEILLDCTRRIDLDRILIEPSGILIPDVITELFDDRRISENLRLEPMVHIVDASLYSRIYRKLPPFIQRQIKMSGD